MILGLLILLASGLYAYLGGWMVVVFASGAVGVASFIEAWTVKQFVETLLFVAIIIAMVTIFYDFWWHNLAGSMRATGEAVSYYSALLVSEGVLIVLILAKMVRAFNGQ